MTARARNYWGVLTATVLFLVMVTWGTEKLIEADTWPFRWVWGGTLVLSGIIMFVMSILSPERIRRLPGGNPSAPLPPPPPREARLALGALYTGVLVGGLAYGLTGRLAVLTIALVVAALVGRLIAARDL